MSDFVRTEFHKGVVLLTLDNPPLNLVTRKLTQLLNAKLDELASDPSVLVLVVRGAGERAFCAGSDLSEFPEYLRDGNVIEKKLRYENETYSKLDDFPKPTIAALNGLAYGGGLELAVCCDLIVADESVKIALPEIKLGVFPGSGGSTRVSKRVGEGRAKEMMFLGEPMTAQQAYEWGLINRLAAKGEAVDMALALAAVLTTRSNAALRLCKKAVDLSLDLPEDEAIRRTLKLSEMAFATHDGQEGVRAFFAKEPPRFTHS